MCLVLQDRQNKHLYCLYCIILMATRTLLRTVLVSPEGVLHREVLRYSLYTFTCYQVWITDNSRSANRWKKSAPPCNLNNCRQILFGEFKCMVSRLATKWFHLELAKSCWSSSNKKWHKCKTIGDTAEKMCLHYYDLKWV